MRRATVAVDEDVVLGDYELGEGPAVVCLPGWSQAHEALAPLELGEVTLLGHSMGVAVIWAYLDVFGEDRLDRLVLADSRPTLIRDRDWSDDEARIAGGTQTLAELEDLTHRLRGPDGWNALVEVLHHMVSPELPPERFEALLATNRATANPAGGSHFAFWEHPERFSEIVGSFLAVPT